MLAVKTKAKNADLYILKTYKLLSKMVFAYPDRVLHSVGLAFTIVFANVREKAAAA
jgi:hypothetical protein